MLKERLLAEALDCAPDAIVIADAAGGIVFANTQVRTLLGYEPAELIGRNIESLLPERLRGRHMAYRQRYMDQPSVRPMGTGLDLYALRRDGAEVPVEISLSPIHNGVFYGLVAAALRDATERKKTQAELIAAREAADRAYQVKSRFLATASHDLRQPLQSLALLNGALRRIVADPTAREALAHQDQAVEAMSRLLNALLDISKLESGAVRPYPADFALAALFEEMRAEFNGVAASKGLELRIARPVNYVHSDRALVGQILRNLISNALKYTASGAVELRCAVTDTALRIEVRDTGIGIPSDQLTHIFDEFYQVPRGSNASREGYGLGLSIVQRLVDLLGLKITVHSEPGAGSVFALELPRGSTGAADGARAAPTPGPAAAAASGASPVVLLVDDDAGVLKATSLLLKVEGYRVIAASSAAEALQSARDNPTLDLLITDYHLGRDQTGRQVIEAVRAAVGHRVKAILVTGDTSSTVRDQHADDAVHLVSKPIDAEQLLALLRALLAA
jgi:two-component system, sensor histidine kinase